MYSPSNGTRSPTVADPRDVRHDRPGHARPLESTSRRREPRRWHHRRLENPRDQVRGSTLPPRRMNTRTDPVRVAGPAQPRRPPLRFVQATSSSLRSLVPPGIGNRHSFDRPGHSRCHPLGQDRPRLRLGRPDRFDLDRLVRCCCGVVLARERVQRPKVGGQQTVGRGRGGPRRLVLGGPGWKDPEAKGTARVPLRAQEYVRLLHAARSEPPRSMLPSHRVARRESGERLNAG